MSLESYAHSLAKQLMAKWLRDLAAPANDDYVSMGNLSWRVNRGTHPYGVWLEYPVLANGGGICNVWDEHPSEKWKINTPTYDELCMLKSPPKYIYDIAIQHKGMISHCIEIVHKNPPLNAKVDFTRSQGLCLWVIPTHWILGQVEPPESIPLEFCENPAEWWKK